MPVPPPRQLLILYNILFFLNRKVLKSLTIDIDKVIILKNIMKRPFFSVIIPTYNRDYFLKIALESVLYQSFTDFELIVVDDGSSDYTKELVSMYPQVKYIYTLHRGVSFCRNLGIKESCGEFVAFLDSDDRFRKEKLEVFYNYICTWSEYKVFHSEELWYHQGRILPQKKYHKKPDGFVFTQALKICCISMSTAVIHRSVFDKVGLFDEDMEVCEDYEFWLRVTSQFPVKLIPEVLTIKEGGHPDQQSRKYHSMDKFRIYSIAKLMRNFPLTDEQYNLAFEELKYKVNIYVQGAIKRGKDEEVRYYKELIESFKERICGKI